jgi:hypothetical protein
MAEVGMPKFSVQTGCVADSAATTQTTNAEIVATPLRAVGRPNTRER